MHKIKWSFILGILVTIAFFSLLLIRLDFLPKDHEPVIKVQFSKSQQPQDIWMNIFQNNQKIGFIHRTLARKDNRFQFKEKVLMEINMMGVTQALNILTEGILNSDMTVASFNFNLNSSIFSFHAAGHVAGNKLILSTGSADAQEKMEIPLKEIPHLGGSIYEAAFQNNLDKETARSFSLFDPSTMSIRPIKVTRNADEIIPVMGKRVLTKKYCADFMGAKNCAWLDKEGNVLKETGIMGLSMEKTSKEKALAGMDQATSFDMTELASIASNVHIKDPEKLNEIKIRITGISNDLFLNGGRQAYHNDTLTVTKETLAASTNDQKVFPAGVALYLQPSFLIQSDDPQIKKQLLEIIKPTDTARQKAEKIIAWVHRHLEKRPTLSVPNALEVLKNKSGDCNEHAVLAVALLRAAGIPAQSEAGLVYLRGRFYYHAWCVFYVDKWITADAVFNQLPADVTHVRLIRGETDRQLNLMGVIGRIKLEVMEQKR
ncbi:MAG TPA: transglutaminase domain-containing protein [Smithella sp.]|nr:transglutaminase domain-containing protein [Smithella sp.]HOG90367.1 transglutaminase domain-containing protein [Smithella sp.]HOU50006.1 transglutaminase domain-containing protein [Smithella sp.]HQG64992.1 transglutaminase domain-containing protein [Smithella sp.]HQH15940.1 transglutaminase domain-containing protein [Smithella sp.]